MADNKQTTKILFEELRKDVSNNKTKGSIVVDLAGVSCKITGKDAVGHLVQEWFLEWCNKNDFNIVANSHTQAFPDYFLGKEGNTDGMLEIKNFNFSASPSFDVADFYAFIETLENDIHKLYADYIVFGYELNEKGELIVPKIWKLKIWEITGKSDDNHITCQIRGKKCQVPENKKLSIKNIDLKGRIQKFRPYNFKLAKPNNKFNSPLEFLTAVQMLLSCNELTRKEYSSWLEKIKKSHKEKYKRDLE